MRIWSKQELATARRQYGTEPDGTPSTQIQYRERARALGIDIPDPVHYVPWAATWDEYCGLPDGGMYGELRAHRHALVILAVIAAAAQHGDPPRSARVVLATAAAKYEIGYARITTGLQAQLVAARDHAWPRVLEIGQELAKRHTPQEIAATDIGPGRKSTSKGEACCAASSEVLRLALEGAPVVSRNEVTPTPPTYPASADKAAVEAAYGHTLGLQDPPRSLWFSPLEEEIPDRPLKAPLVDLVINQVSDREAFDHVEAALNELASDTQKPSRLRRILDWFHGEGKA